MIPESLLISLIADYGTGDPAFSEVTQRLRMDLPHAHIHWLSVPPFNTLATGFWIAQLGLNPGPTPRLIYHNCAPRQDDPDARLDNEGEGLTYACLPNGVKVVGVNAGYTLAFIKNYTTALQVINVSRGGSQFRSRDVFPQAVGAIARDDFSLLGAALNPAELPDVPDDRIAWVDGYGNIKTTISADSLTLAPEPLAPETKVLVKSGERVCTALYSDGSFKVPEGTLAFAPGSSGWQVGQDPPVRWMELFRRGGNAWERLGNPSIGQKISYSVA